MPRNAHRGATLKYPDVGDRKRRMHCPPAAVSSTSSCSVQICTSTMASSASSFMADDAGTPDVDEIRKLVGGRTLPPVVAKHHVEIGPGGFILRQRHDGGDAFALLPAAGILIMAFAASVWRRPSANRQTFSLYTCPRDEKKKHRACGSRPRTGGWTKSSSRVCMPERPFAAAAFAPGRPTAAPRLT